MLTPELILRHIEGSPRQRATLKQLLRELNARGGERQKLRSALAALVSSRRLVERRRVFELAAPLPPQPGRPPHGRSAGKRASGSGIAPRLPGVSASLPTAADSHRKAASLDSGRARVGSGEIRGRISIHRDGYGFVTPESARKDLPGDIFIPPPALGGAMQGDHVAVRIVRKRGFSGETRMEGAVEAVLVRRQRTLVGIFYRDPRGSYVQPIDERIREKILIPPGAELPAQPLNPHRVLGEQAASPAPRTPHDIEGFAVEVELTEFPSASAAARGRVIEVLGRREDFGVDVEIIIRKHHLPHHFPEPVLAEAQALAPALPAAELARRRDFRQLPIVTIDGESARDFDDAIVVTRSEHGYELQVHIADVSYYVQPGSAIDLEAQERGTSVYFPDRAVPMLPMELSTNLCSLRPHEDRLVMSCLMQIDREGEVVDYELLPGVIRSAARMTYSQVNAVIEGDAEARRQFQSFASGFDLMAELQSVLYAKRARLGSIDFDLPEPEIAFDEMGLMKSIVKSERNTAHRLIEEFMLVAAETVARHMQTAGRASIYRIHEQPDLKKVAEFEQIAATFGYSLGVGPLPIQRMRVRGRVVEVPQPGKFRISPRHYQRLAARIAGKPEERMLSFLMLRSLKQARYSADNVGHFALAAACYTHFTSPIRRYPDLLLHRILKAQLAGEPPPARLAAPESLEPLCRQASESERRADDAERELMDWKKVRFMENRLGEEFPALIIHVTRQGFYVELSGLFVEGFVPAASLEDDAYHFLDASQAWVGERSKRRYRLGDQITVIVDRIDPVRQQIHFAPVAAPETAGAAPARPRRRKSKHK